MISRDKSALNILGLEYLLNNKYLSIQYVTIKLTLPTNAAIGITD